jgi:hypothetical protein
LRVADLMELIDLVGRLPANRRRDHAAICKVN